MLNRKVDFEIIKILKQRYFRCSFYERAVNEFYDLDKICQKELKDLKQAELNLFIKCKSNAKNLYFALPFEIDLQILFTDGELGPYSNVVDAFMKQKHRLIWERRQKEKQEASH